MAVELETPPIKTSSGSSLRRVALAGNPNAGKTTLFNALTGMRQKVGNYPGVTVEKKEGRCTLTSGNEVLLLDLPGTYSLSPKSPDEEVARDVLLGLRGDTPSPDAVVIVLDASNLERNLYLATQILELGIPTVIALNMNDVARTAGKSVDAHQLSIELGVPVVSLVAVKGEGVPQLKATLLAHLDAPNSPALNLPENLDAACNTLADALSTPSSDEQRSKAGARGVALRLLASEVQARTVGEIFGPNAAGTLAELRADKSLTPLAVGASEAAARYAMLNPLVERVVRHHAGEASKSFTDRADAVLTHKYWGLVIFGLITLLVFQAIFSWASLPMDFVDKSITAFGDWVRGVLPDGPVEDLLVEGVIAGVGAVVIFLPQILILFFFIGLLEDTGYMARAAFIMDRLMGKVGLHGRAFIPLMSSFACAIPGIMATRTISSRNDRMTTIMIAPLMACSARLPVYYLMIAAFIPNIRLWGFSFSSPFGERFLGLTLPTAVIFSLYALGVILAMAMAWLFKKTIFAGPQPALMLELPPYKMPGWRNIIVTMWERGSQFLKRAGTVILAISIVLWFMLSYPKIDRDAIENVPTSSPAAGIRPGPGNAPPTLSEPSDEDPNTARENRLAALQQENSFAGRIGRVIEPIIAPLGFNWKIGVGLIGAMAAREVFVSTMGTVYAVGDADETSQSLKDQMKNDRWPDGTPVWTTLTAISLMVYFVIAMQCISTLAVVKRETNSWKWPLFMQFYLTALAWLAAFLVFQGGRLLGW